MKTSADPKGLLLHAKSLMPRNPLFCPSPFFFPFRDWITSEWQPRPCEKVISFWIKKSFIFCHFGHFSKHGRRHLSRGFASFWLVETPWRTYWRQKFQRRPCHIFVFCDARISSSSLSVSQQQHHFLFLTESTTALMHAVRRRSEDTRTNHQKSSFPSSSSRKKVPTVVVVWCAKKNIVNVTERAWEYLY